MINLLLAILMLLMLTFEYKHKRSLVWLAVFGILFLINFSLGSYILISNS